MKEAADSAVEEEEAAAVAANATSVEAPDISLVIAPMPDSNVVVDTEEATEVDSSAAATTVEVLDTFPESAPKLETAVDPTRSAATTARSLVT